MPSLSLSVGASIQQVVLRVEEIQAGVERLSRQVSLIEEECSSEPCGLEDIQKLEGDVLDARKHLRNYSEDLLEDMLLLDKLTDLDSQSRAARKDVLARSESLLNSLDAAKIRLDSIHDLVRKKMEILKNRSSHDAVVEIPPYDFWKTVPLTLHWRTRQSHNSYMVTAHLKTCRLEELRVQILSERRDLLITGVCVPSHEAAARLEKTVQEHLRGIGRRNMALRVM